MGNQTLSSHKKQNLENCSGHISSAEYHDFGAIGGTALRCGKHGPGEKGKFDAVAGSFYMRALTREDRRKLGRDLREKHNTQSTT